MTDQDRLAALINNLKNTETMSKIQDDKAMKYFLTVLFRKWHEEYESRQIK